MIGIVRVINITNHQIVIFFSFHPPHRSNPYQHHHTTIAITVILELSIPSSFTAIPLPLSSLPPFLVRRQCHPS